MSFFKRVFGAGISTPRTLQVSFFEGDVPLEVVGESYHQDALERLAGGKTEEGADVEVVAVLTPEPDNPYDSNAVGVFVSGLKVGHLRRSVAARYQEAIIRLEQEEAKPIAVRGRIVGGWLRDDGDEGHFGIRLYHDPVDFGFAPVEPRRARQESTVRTGASSARMRWAEGLNMSNHAEVIKRTREGLEAETDPIERHFMYLALEEALYKCRNLFESALAEFEEACEAHHAEMEEIRPALLQEFDGLPTLPTYRQAAIMKRKAHDYESALAWCLRGLDVYGEDCLREDAVEDLRKRVEKLRTKLVSG